MNAYAAEDGWPVGVTKKGWLAKDFDVAAATHAFTPGELEFLLALVDKTRAMGLKVTEITREVFDCPELHELFAQLVQKLKCGQGLLILSGFPVRERSEEDIWRMYWGIGTHFGIAVSQNTFGDLQGKVTVTPGTVGGRVYGSSAAAPFHSDRIDILTLLCINKARVGGANEFINALALWEAIERERPDLFELLKRGYPQVRNGEQPAGHAPVTPYRVPVFGEVDGFRSCYFGGNAMLSHQRQHFAEMLTDQDAEALTYLQEAMGRPEFILRQQLEPGEAVFINNMEMLHSREAFQDGDGPHEKRLLLRLWLQGRPMRPKPHDMTIIRNLSGMLGIEPKLREAGD
jgi:hypothetical protein